MLNQLPAARSGKKSSIEMVDSAGQQEAEETLASLARARRGGSKAMEDRQAVGRGGCSDGATSEKPNHAVFIIVV